MIPRRTNIPAGETTEQKGDECGRTDFESKRALYRISDN